MFKKNRMSKTLLSAALLLGAIGVHAEEKPPVFFSHYEKGTVMIDGCFFETGQEKCVAVNAPAEPLRVALNDIVSHYDTLLAEPDKLNKMIKTQSESALLASPLVDPETQKSYIMISIGQHFNLPFEVELAKKGDYSMVVGALSFERSRYKKSLDALELLTTKTENGATETLAAAPDGTVDTTNADDGIENLYQTIRFSRLL